MTNEKDTIWNVIYCASRSEKKVAKQLEKDNVEYYLPLVRRLREWSDRKKWVDMPLLNGYIFVRTKTPKERENVLRLPGVVKFVRYNGADARVRQYEIDLIVNLIAKGYDVSEFTDKDEFVVGDDVEVRQGPMKGFSGTIIRINGERYAVITFEMLATNIKAKLPLQVLRRKNVG